MGGTYLDNINQIVEFSAIDSKIGIAKAKGNAELKMTEFMTTQMEVMLPDPDRQKRIKEQELELQEMELKIRKMELNTRLKKATMDNLAIDKQ